MNIKESTRGGERRHLVTTPTALYTWNTSGPVWTQCQDDQTSYLLFTWYHALTYACLLYTRRVLQSVQSATEVLMKKTAEGKTSYTNNNANSCTA